MVNCESEVYYRDLPHDGVLSNKKSTQQDQRDMCRMGKQQELRRNFRFVSIFGYSMVLMAIWETMLTYVRLHSLLTPSDTPTAH
jgi:hypothetical protein